LQRSAEMAEEQGDFDEAIAFATNRGAECLML
jgi:hypothetical protein